MKKLTPFERKHDYTRVSTILFNHRAYFGLNDDYETMYEWADSLCDTLSDLLDELIDNTTTEKVDQEEASIKEIMEDLGDEYEDADDYDKKQIDEFRASVKAIYEKYPPTK